MVDDLSTSEESAFVAEEIERIVSVAIQNTLKDQIHEEAKVASWINSICEASISELAALLKPFKYTVSCVIMQKNGAGLHTATSCYWDTVTDGLVTVKWPGDKQRDQGNTMYCVVTVFGLGI